MLSLHCSDQVRVPGRNEGNERWRRRPLQAKPLLPGVPAPESIPLLQLLFTLLYLVLRLLQDVPARGGADEGFRCHDGPSPGWNCSPDDPRRSSFHSAAPPHQGQDRIAGHNQELSFGYNILPEEEARTYICCCGGNGNVFDDHLYFFV